jgi:hypothetical protein
METTKKRKKAAVIAATLMTMPIVYIGVLWLVARAITDGNGNDVGAVMMLGIVGPLILVFLFFAFREVVLPVWDDITDWVEERLGD